MASYLALCQKLRRECGIAGSGPNTVVGQTGMMEKIVNWVADSYLDIQLRYPNWRWMRSNFTVIASASDDTYPFLDCTDDKTSAAINRFAQWWANDRLDPFKIYLTSAGVANQGWMNYLPYENFRALYKFGPQQSVTGQPFHVSVDDDDQIVIGPKPNGTYTLQGSYQRGPQILVADANEPDMPGRFHDLIVYYAMERYATHSVAPEVLARAIREGGRIMRALEQSQMPQIRFGRPLA